MLKHKRTDRWICANSRESGVDAQLVPFSAPLHFFFPLSMRVGYLFPSCSIKRNLLALPMIDAAARVISHGCSLQRQSRTSMSYIVCALPGADVTRGGIARISHARGQILVNIQHTDVENFGWLTLGSQRGLAADSQSIVQSNEGQYRQQYRRCRRAKVMTRTSQNLHRCLDSPRLAPISTRRSARTHVDSNSHVKRVE